MSRSDSESAGPVVNRLAGTGSPYLQQHAGNPVHWTPWGREPFEEARRRDAPVLVSIGYSTCHWCHVMAHESFEDPAIAELMNAALVNVKVDREQHPGVDAAFMEAAQALMGAGGWPLNVFTDPDGRPFLAVTYLPPDRWTALVREVDRLWREEHERVEKTAAGLSDHLRKRVLPEAKDRSALPEGFMNAALAAYDEENPGFARGGVPMRFPPSQAVDWLLEYGGTRGRAMAMEILRAIADSGLHDRVGGGFHRYSTEETWRIPHFEKMTYDNAQLMGLYARASALTGEGPLADRFAKTARDAAGWFLGEMRVISDDGTFLGYATATDADDPAGEGAYFAWPPSELASILGEEDARWLAARWDLSGEGGLPAASDGHGGTYEPAASWIPHPRGSAGYGERLRRESLPEPSDDEARDAAREAVLAEKLKSARGRRPAPSRDSKVLTDQNALILEGFVRLARYLGDERAQEAAVELAGMLIRRFGLDEAAERTQPRVLRAEGLDACVTDYGYLAMALTGTYGLTGDVRYVLAAQRTAEEAVRRLSAGDDSFYSIPGDDGNLFKRPIEEFDGPSPAGQYALGIAFARLHAITGTELWRNRADRLLESRAVVSEAAPLASATLVRLASIRRGGRTLVIAGPADDVRTRDLLETVRRAAGPDAMAVAADSAARSGAEDWVELEGRVGLERPQLLVCTERGCLAPAFDAEEALVRLGSDRP